MKPTRERLLHEYRELARAGGDPTAYLSFAETSKAAGETDLAAFALIHFVLAPTPPIEERLRRARELVEEQPTSRHFSALGTVESMAGNLADARNAFVSAIALSSELSERERIRKLGSVLTGDATFGSNGQNDPEEMRRRSEMWDELGRARGLAATEPKDAELIVRTVRAQALATGELRIASACLRCLLQDILSVNDSRSLELLRALAKEDKNFSAAERLTLSQAEERFGSMELAFQESLRALDAAVDPQEVEMARERVSFLQAKINTH